MKPYRWLVAMLVLAVVGVVGAQWLAQHDPSRLGQVIVRSGGWATGRFPMTRRVSGARLGIVGLGRIGRAVATRAQAFGMDIAYTGRTPKDDVAYQWYDDALTLAASVDFLVVCASAASAPLSIRASVSAPPLAPTACALPQT